MPIDIAIGTKEKQEGRGGCGLEGTSDNRVDGGRKVPFFVLTAIWWGKEAKNLSFTRQCLTKKRRKVRIEMQGGHDRDVGRAPVASYIVQKDQQEGTFFLLQSLKQRAAKQ